MRAERQPYSGLSPRAGASRTQPTSGASATRCPLGCPYIRSVSTNVRASPRGLRGTRQVPSRRRAIAAAGQRRKRAPGRRQRRGRAVMALISRRAVTAARSASCGRPPGRLRLARHRTGVAAWPLAPATRSRSPLPATRCCRPRSPAPRAPTVSWRAACPFEPVVPAPECHRLPLSPRISSASRRRLPSLRSRPHPARPLTAMARTTIDKRASVGRRHMRRMGGRRMGPG